MQGCTGVSAAGLNQLQQCMRLRYLDLSATQVVGLGFLELRRAPKKGDGVCVSRTRACLSGLGSDLTLRSDTSPRGVWSQESLRALCAHDRSAACPKGFIAHSTDAEPCIMQWPAVLHAASVPGRLWCGAVIGDRVQRL